MSRRTRDSAALVAVVVLFVCLARQERALVEPSPAQVSLVVWTWLPGRVASGLLGGLALLCAAGALAQLLHLTWLGLRPAPGEPGAWGHLEWHRLALSAERSRKEALLADLQLLLVTTAGAAVLAGASWWCGATHRVALDLDGWRYRRSSEYLGLLPLRAVERPLGEVVEASLEERRSEDDEGRVTVRYAVAFSFLDGGGDSISGPREECQRAVEACQALLARRFSRGVERPDEPTPPGRR